MVLYSVRRVCDLWWDQGRMGWARGVRGDRIMRASEWGARGGGGGMVGVG